MRVNFYKRDNRWYADLPDYIESGGTEEECEMVLGADTWLDILSNGKDRVSIFIGEGTGVLTLIEKDNVGATYATSIGLNVWLCNVTVFVLGHFPEKIIYKVLTQ